MLNKTDKDVVIIQHVFPDPQRSAIARQLALDNYLTNATDRVYKFGPFVQSDVTVPSCRVQL